MIRVMRYWLLALALILASPARAGSATLSRYPPQAPHKRNRRPFAKYPPLAKKSPLVKRSPRHEGRYLLRSGSPALA